MLERFDLAVIGGGPGGYVAAIRAAQLGMKVVLIEKQNALGGTCLNVGCIPSKALLDSSELYYQALTQFKNHGVQIGNLTVNLEQMMKRKEEVISTTTQGVRYLMKKNKIAVLEGVGSIKDPHSIVISNQGKESVVAANNIIIATGSKAARLPTIPIDGRQIISSDEAISLRKIPKKMIVIGGGIIGVELGSVYARLGSKVTVIELLDGLIAPMDRELGKALERSLKLLSFEFHFNTKVTTASLLGKQVQLTSESKNRGTISFEGDIVLVAVGRTPYTEGLGLNPLGIHVDSGGRIEINERFQTSVPSIYAIGDVIRGPKLAHKASEEGIACVELIAGNPPHLNYNTIPSVVYTWPEVASVGSSEEQLKTSGIEYKKGSFPFKASGRARAAGELEGFIKVLSDKLTDEILGIHMIGPRVSDMVAQAVVAMEYRASAQDIGLMMHAHPTFSEAVKEASLMAASDRAIHI